MIRPFTVLCPVSICVRTLCRRWLGRELPAANYSVGEPGTFFTPYTLSAVPMVLIKGVCVLSTWNFLYLDMARRLEGLISGAQLSLK